MDPGGDRNVAPSLTTDRIVPAQLSRLEKRVYRGVWNIVQRTWQGERWIRVTDNEGLAKFIQVNGLETDPFGQPVIINAIGSLNVEIALDEGPDEGSLMQDACDVLKQYPPGAIPPQVLIELSPLSSKMKQRVLALLQQPVDPQVMQAKGLALQKTAADITEKQAAAQRHRSQSAMDAARAVHLVSEAHLNGAHAFKTAVEAAAGPQSSNAQPSPQSNGAPGPLVPPTDPPLSPNQPFGG